MRSRGFTLLEVVVVLLILGSVTVLTLPSLHVLDSEREPAAATANELLDLFRYARLVALRDGQAVRVVLEPDRLRYSLRVDGDGIRREMTEGTLTPSPVTIVPSEMLQYDFDPRGTPRGGQSLRVRDATSCRVVSVAPWTGEASARGC